MKKAERIQWLMQKMSGINAHNGTKNCALVALRLDEILNEPETVYTKPVTVKDPHIFTDPRYSEDQERIIKSYCSDPRILARCVPKTIISLTSDVAEEIDSKDQVLSIQFSKANSATIKDKLINTSRRKKDGSAHGFILYTNKDKELGGHLANFLVDADNNVYFLDAQRNAHPQTFVREDPADEFLDEIFFITSIPPEGFRNHEYNTANSLLHTEDRIKMKEDKTAEYSPMHGPATKSSSGSTASTSDKTTSNSKNKKRIIINSSAAADSASSSSLQIESTKRIRLQTAKLQPDFSAASKSSYKYAPVSSNNDSESVDLDVHDTSALDNLLALADEESNVLPKLSGESKGTSHSSSNSKKMSTVKIGDIKGAIEADLLSKFVYEIKGMDINDLSASKIYTSKGKECSLLRFIIDNNKYNFIKPAIDAGALADLDCFERVLKRCALRNNPDGDCIDHIVASLKSQKIMIPEALIQFTRDTKKVKGYGDAYIPELCNDFTTHNESLSTVSQPNILATFASTVLNVVQPQPEVELPKEVQQAIAVQANNAPAYIAESPSIAPSTGHAADKDLVPVPTLASLRARLQTLKHSQQVVKSDFNIYETETNNLLQSTAATELALIEYQTTKALNNKLKMELFDKIHQFKKNCEQSGDEESFFKAELPDMYKAYKAALDQKRALETSLLDDINTTQQTLPILNPKDVKQITYSLPAASAAAAPAPEGMSPKRLRVTAQELNDPSKLEDLIEKISTQFRSEIGSCLSKYLDSCKALETQIPSFIDKLTTYRKAFVVHNQAKDNLWHTVTKMLKNDNSTGFNAEAALKAHCPEMFATYSELTEKRRASRLSLQQHLHNLQPKKQLTQSLTSSSSEHRAAAPAPLMPAPSMPSYSPASLYFAGSQPSMPTYVAPAPQYTPIGSAYTPAYSMQQFMPNAPAYTPGFNSSSSATRQTAPDSTPKPAY